MKRIGHGFSLLLLSATVLRGELPTRPPELDKLNDMVGTWDVEGILRNAPDAKEFKTKGTQTIYWSPSRHFLIADHWTLTPYGWFPKIVITSWDPKEKQYRLTNIFPVGSYTTMMTIEKKDKITTETNDGGHVTKTWTTITELSPTQSRLRIASQIDDGPRWVFSEEIHTKRPSTSDEAGKSPRPEGSPQQN